MSSAASNGKDSVGHSDPIPINTAFRGHRARSFSISSSASSASASSPSEAQTPPSPTIPGPQRASIQSPSSSPILAYFLAQSPKTPSTMSTFPLSRKFGQAPLFEEEGPETEILATAHIRRASALASRYQNPQPTSLPEQHQERGAGLLRRLSLGSAAFNKPLNDSPTGPHPPSPPPNTAVAPTPKDIPFSRDSKPKRSATLGADMRPRRAPSPMGERILKGHFDGFN
ncbi:hypothetical protein BDN72DRAFT_893335 [Pluteus cervinus]|uniref:Uncharacterized protein n=1 Tax=Pluteus cervinus TaxID=181527 RepID=A0ACD3BAS8_9AGAR|nr:hypothetical protein BDN72DRAFT_893335 [Pluteus cervinus]